MTTFRTIALIGKYHHREVAATLADLVRIFRDSGCTPLIEAETAASVGDLGAGVADCARIGAEADLAVVVGGDGTMLHSARLLAEYGVPLVGVNEGRLGFMTDIAREGVRAAMADILAGNYSKEQRPLLETSLWRGGNVVFSGLALNDVVINKGELGRMIELEVRVDDELIHVLRADGLILATPTGSTAYALSANGPILHPGVAGIAVVPLCPHALTYRPITVSDDSRIDIVLIAPHEGRVHLDGQNRFDLHGGDALAIRRSARSVCLVHPPGYSYFSMLRQKLHWSSTPRA